MSAWDSLLNTPALPQMVTIFFIFRGDGLRTALRNSVPPPAELPT